MASILEKHALQWATQANESGESDRLAEAIGKGFAAVTCALLEVADAIRKGPEPNRYRV